MYPKCSMCHAVVKYVYPFLRANWGRRYHPYDPTVVQLCNACVDKHVKPEPNVYTRIKYLDLTVNE